MNKGTVACVAACLLLATASPAGAAGDGIRIGPGLVYPSLAVTATHDSNIHLVSQAPEGGRMTTVSPALRLVLPVRRLYLAVDGGLDFRSFSGIDQDNYTDWFFGGAVGANFPGGLSFKVEDRQSGRFLLGSQEYGVDLGQFSIISGEDYTENDLDATVAYVIRDSLRVALTGSRTDIGYSVSKRRARVETSVQADLFWKFRPAISAVLGAGYEDYGYDTNTAQDNSATQAALGVTWDVTAKSTGTLKAGVQWKRYDAQNQALGTEDASYYTVSAAVRHFFTRRTALHLHLSRSSQESDFPANPYFIRTAADASLVQRLTARLHGRLTARYGLDDYPNGASFDNSLDPVAEVETGVRRDTTLAAEAAVGYDVNRWLSLKLEYDFGTRNSNFDTFDYDVSRVSLSVKAAF